MATKQSSTPTALIKEALSATVHSINLGQTPTNALIKAAKEYDLNPHYIQRTGEALNVALHYNHFKKAADRSSDFPIANIPEVITEMFGKTEKTAHQKRSEQFIPGQLSEKIPNYEKKMYNPKYKRAYQELLESGKDAQNTKFASTYSGVFDKCLGYLDKLKMAADVAKSEKVAADFKLNRAFGDLVNHFSKTAYARTPWHEIESQVYSKHGDESKQYIDFVYKTAGLKEDRGIQDSKYTIFDQCKEAQMFDNLFKAITEAGKADENEKDAEYNYKFEKDFYNEIIRQSGNIKSAEDIKKNSSDSTVASTVTKESSFDLLDILSNRFSQSVDPKNSGRPNPLVNTARDDLQRKLVLQELIMTDPLLSKESPQKVVAAYEQLLRVAPELSKEKEVVRSLLREMMATQSLNPHTSNMLTEADLNLMKQRLMQHGGVASGK